MKSTGMPQTRRQSTRPKISKGIPSDSDGYTSRAFFIAPIDDRLSTQPTRLNRARMHLVEPETTREAVTKMRATWAAYRLLMNLTVASFRNYLAEDFRRLPLPEMNWSQFHHFKSVVDDDLFWRLVEEALDIDKGSSGKRVGQI